MGHMHQHGMNTSSRGMFVDSVCVTGLNVANGQLCTIAEDGKSGFVASVTHTATGVYTFQLTVPYPPRRIIIQPSMSATAATSVNLSPRYQTNSYNATTGQFIINVNNAGAAADGGATDELHVDFRLVHYNRS